MGHGHGALVVVNNIWLLLVRNGVLFYFEFPAAAVFDFPDFRNDISPVKGLIKLIHLTFTLI